MKIQRAWAMPSHETFSIKPIRQLVKHYLSKSKVSVDVFARNNLWATYTNDLNPKTAAQYHMPAIDFLKHLQSQSIKADLILFDPPYSSRQIVECYQGIGLDVSNLTFEDYAHIGYWKQEKDICADLLKPNGIFLHFGWHSNGCGIDRGFEIEQILLVAHGRCHNDTICTVEQKLEKPVGLFEREILNFQKSESALLA